MRGITQNDYASYEDYIASLRVSIWNLYYSDFIDDETFIKLKDKFMEKHEKMMNKKSRYWESRRS